MIIQPASLNLIIIVRAISRIFLKWSFIQRPTQLQRVLHLERMWSSQHYSSIFKASTGPFNLEIDLSYRIPFAMELWDHWRDEANSQERTEINNTQFALIEASEDS